jgi:hypothetical protein
MRNGQPVEAAGLGGSAGNQQQESSQVCHSRHVPPRRGWGLGLRLAVLASTAVTAVMAAISGVQLAADLRSELQERQQLLAASLTPLVSELRDVPDAEAARAALVRFHASYVGAGQVNHYVGLATMDGKVLLDTGNQGESKESLAASMPLMATALGPDLLQVLVRQEEDERLAADHARRWRAWAVHVAVTAIVVLLLLFFVIRREVTRPIERLLQGIRKMELGYWDDVPDPGGAWETRWLAWRFRTIGGELRLTVTHLSLEQVHDLLALRVVVPTVSDCYHALGVVHDLHEPLVDRFKDYIEHPKPNGYQGLHTTVQSSRGFVFEVQIRSLAMHRLAEHGEASHSTYKARNTPDADERSARPRLWKRLARMGGR